MFGMVFVTAGHAASLWDHNGSIVSLEASGADRKFYYQTPRAGMPVSPGTLLFEGRRNGNRYSGTAYIFSKACGSQGYAVSGNVSADDRRVTMQGKAPRRDTACRVIGYRDDVLVFSLRASDPGAPSLADRSLASLETIAAIAREFARDHIDRERTLRIASQVADAQRSCNGRESCIREVLLAAIGDYLRIARSGL
jgi:hypothetical protein